MNHPIPGRRCLRFILPCLTAAAASAWACSVPVFRYALEHWQPDLYQAVVLHRGPLSGHGQALIRKLRPGSEAGASVANLSVQTVDLAQNPQAEMLDIWKQAGSPGTPWLVILPPRALQLPGRVYSAALDEAAINAVPDSPARREIARRIGDGESAVWVLLESGDKARDDAAAKLLESRLDYLAGVMELPKLDEQDIKNGLISLPGDGLRLAFSTLRVARLDPAERFFVHLLLATEKDLTERAEPMVFPVFGRARVLYALVGPGIKHETIDEAASFLIGSCSCQVKEQNPGTDLLMAADWPKLLKAQSVGLRDLPKVSDIVSDMPEAVIIAPRSAAGDKAGVPCCALSAWVQNHLLAVAALAVIGLGALGWFVMRKVAAGPVRKP